MTRQRSIRGDWMGAIYGVSGKPLVWSLNISDSGCYQSKRVYDDSDPQQESGSWHYDDEKEILTFDPDGDGDSHAWWVRDVTRSEGANTLLVLRQCILASRNLPIVLYRVHHKPFDP